MSSNIIICFISTLLLLNLVQAKPISSLQSLKQLLEEDSNAPYLTSEEKVEKEDKDMNSDNFNAENLPPWGSGVKSSALSENENAIARLLNDILSTSKRSWSRFKKGGLRSCFGVRLERIGSFSGLGC
ncbi:natriuretic peptide A-like [Paramormyrops kingsleyae]|uniref:Natriuretic peptide A-like n=1 Tax=Paramormyrops kingsleyae TaxID=1676925 RepID=A0A3B3SW92_9TELE|nr:C-type natriuretic peptide 3-like [Paramormyrops kingsleyae]